jgi:hypothetical protein
MKTADVIANEALQREVERLTRIVAKYDTERLERESDLMLERLEARKAEEQAAADKAAAEKQTLNELNIPRPETLEQYSKLPVQIKSRLISAYSGDFPLELAAKNRSGLSWSDWDKLRAAEAQ